MRCIRSMSRFLTMAVEKEKAMTLREKTRSSHKLTEVQVVAQPIVLTHFEQTAPYRKYRHSFSGEPRRPSLDLEKMQQKMLLKKNCGGKTRTIKIRSLNNSRPSPRFTYDPSIFAFRSLSTGPPCSVLTQPEDPSSS
ncbi:uncharacterized protein isoform X2 [Takifugu rubripes]|uniref:uncharacterized protein isoform X2 n=1 Tax=Takifugu rubripes TaxID=31033 RepID=UPI0005D29BE9|nr:uncharacterized protein LOC105417866 isoform X2 [Takifugu rubripes]XP_056914130.1 uncharacterized protein si:dkey-16j16.4 isoform X2 [Takifugu flavidus]|eukprot:XP_011612477.1 PREDICTED: uncharacterized protein LOC105417866 isoform X2 [Takifugu rubripes]